MANVADENLESQRDGLAPYLTPDGVVLGSSTWIVTAQTPRSASSASSSR